MLEGSRLPEEHKHLPGVAVPLTLGLRFRKCNKHRGGAGGGAELRGGAETLRLPAPEDLHRAVSVPRVAAARGGRGVRRERPSQPPAAERLCFFLCSQHLPPGRVLLIPGVSHLPSGAAALLSEPGLPLPWAQEVRDPWGHFGAGGSHRERRTRGMRCKEQRLRSVTSPRDALSLILCLLLGWPMAEPKVPSPCSR